MERTYTSMLRRSRQQMQYASNSINKQEVEMRKGRYPNLQTQCTKKRRQSPDSNPEPYYVSLECQDETDGTLAGLMQISTTPTSSIEYVYTPYDWGINPVSDDVKDDVLLSSPKLQPQKKVKSCPLRGQVTPVLTPNTVHIEIPSYPQSNKANIQSDTYKLPIDKKPVEVRNNSKESKLFSNGFLSRSNTSNKSVVSHSGICPSGDETIPSEGSYTPPWRPHYSSVSPALIGSKNISTEFPKKRIQSSRDCSKLAVFQETSFKNDDNNNKLRINDICESSSTTVRRALGASTKLSSSTTQFNKKPDVPGLHFLRENNMSRLDKCSCDTTASTKGRESWTHRNLQQLVKGLPCPKTPSSGLINRITQFNNRVDYDDSHFKSTRNRNIPLGTPTSGSWKHVEKLTPEQIDKSCSKLRFTKLFGKSASALKIRGVPWNTKGRSIDT